MQSRLLLALAIVAATASASAQNQMTQIRTQVNAEYANLFKLYKHFHAHPELSFHEEKIHRHMGLWSGTPPLAPARSPPGGADGPWTREPCDDVDPMPDYENVLTD